MFNFLLKDLASNSVLLLTILEHYLGMLKYFKEVFEYNNVQPQREDVEEFYLNYSVAYTNVLNQIKVTEEQIKKIKEDK